MTNLTKFNLLPMQQTQLKTRHKTKWPLIWPYLIWFSILIKWRSLRHSRLSKKEILLVTSYNFYKADCFTTQIWSKNCLKPIIFLMRSPLFPQKTTQTATKILLSFIWNLLDGIPPLEFPIKWAYISNLAKTILGFPCL